MRMDPVTRIDVYASGPRGYLHTRVKLPEHLVADLPDLMEGARELNPAVDADAVIRTIWRLGCKALRRNNERDIPVRAADLPHARVTKDDELRPPAPEMTTDRVSGLTPSRV
jgi:hypothetical protein